MTANFIPYLIIPPNTDWNEIIIDSSILINSPATVVIEVTAGSFKFSRDKAGDDTVSPTYTTTVNKCILTFNNQKKLFFQAASTSDRANLSE